MGPQKWGAPMGPGGHAFAARFRNILRSADDGLMRRPWTPGDYGRFGTGPGHGYGYHAH